MRKIPLKDDFLDAVKLALSRQLEVSQVWVPWLQQACEFLENPHKFQAAFDLLEDDESRRIFTWLLKFRTVAFLTKSSDAAIEIVPPIIPPSAYRQIAASVDGLPESKLVGNFADDLIEIFILDGYTLPGLCEVQPNDVVFDLGAYNGNSSICFARKAAPNGRVFAFEPNPLSQLTIAQNLDTVGLTNVEIVAFGVAESEMNYGLIQAGAASRVDLNGAVRINLTTVDRFAADRRFDSIDFIKIDIEGSELSALKGSREVIKRFRPKMAICIYHLHYDMHAIILWLRDVCPWYRFYLRHNHIVDAEVVLFCVPIRRHVPVAV